jgi:hypothetical protein
MFENASAAAGGHPRRLRRGTLALLPHSGMSRLLSGHIRPWLLHGALIGSALVLLFGFAGSGLRAGFTHDDLMNASIALRYSPLVHARDIILFFTPWSTSRPAGSLLYVLLFDTFGFAPLPFRICCYALLAANLLLAFRLAFRLTGSRRVAAVSVLILAYHGNFWAMYVNTGLCYDLLCFFFYSAAFLYYLDVRRSGLAWTWPRVAIWSALYALCLDSKEMAVSLPIVILAWELLTNPPSPSFPGVRGWLLRDARIPLVGAGMTVVFIAGRVFGPNGISAAGGYQTEFSAIQYFRHARHFLSLALYEPRWLTPAAAVALAAAAVAAAALLRAPAFNLSLFWVAIGILPVAFIPQRGLDAVYIPAFAFTICISILAVTAAERLLPRWTPAALAGGLAACVAGLVFWHVHNGLFELKPRQEDSREIAAAFDWFRARQIRFAPDGKTLFLRDPFPYNGYSSAFLLRLYSRNPSLWVDRLDRIVAAWPPERVENFAYVFTVDQGRLLQCEAAPFAGVRVRDLAAVAGRHPHCE